MSNNYSILGDNIQIRKGRSDDYFKYYIERYENGICTLIGGCDSALEVVEKVTKILRQHEEEPK